MRHKLEKDGVLLVPQTEFQSFPAVIHKANPYTLGITIPKDIVKSLNLTHGSIIQVAIRPISEEYSLREYGYVPRLLKGSGRKPVKRRIICPKCGKPGYLYRVPNSDLLYVRHTKSDGFPRKTTHYINKKLRKKLQFSIDKEVSG